MKKDLGIGIGIFTVSLLIDQLTKVWGLELSTLKHNSGFIFGVAENIPTGLRVITLASFFGFLFFLYLILLYLLPVQLKKLKMGISLLMGGIFGNVIDRSLRGSSIDFIPIDFGQYIMTFNFADLFQWIGVAFILYNVIVHEKIIWHPGNQRGRYLVNPKEQVRFAVKFSAIAWCAGLLLGLFSYTFLRTTLIDHSSYQVDETMMSFAIGYLCLMNIFVIIVFFAGLFFSHKTAGPLYAFELYVEDLLKGEERSLVLREGDNYRHLEQIAAELGNYFQNTKSD